MAKTNFLNNRKKPLDKMSGTAKNNIGDILSYYHRTFMQKKKNNHILFVFTWSN